MFDVGTPRSVFYLNTDGQLTSSSLDIPPSEHQSPTCSAGVDQLLVHATDTAQRALENTVDVSTQAKSFFRRAQTSFK
jgi:hypothetical protein